MSNQGTIRLKVTNGAPAIEKLWNGRFKLEFFCDNNSPKEDWYHENVSALLPDYGILQTTNFGSGVSEDWEAIPASVYPDMRLVLAEYPYNVRAGKHYVKLTYETLTASWVEEKDEDTDYELNGLKRVSRTFVALPDTAYDKVVGTSTIDSDGTTLYLGSFKIEKTDAKWSLTEVWLEAGTLSETLDNVGSQKAKVIETIGADPATPNGYSLASKQESDFEGFQTNRFTFLKPSVLSRNIQTKNNGKLIIETVESFNEVPAAETIGAVQIGNEISNVEGTPTNRYTFAKGDGQIFISQSAGPNNIPGTTRRTIRAFGAALTPNGVLIDSQDIVRDGYIEYIRTTLDGAIEGVKTVYADVATVEVPGTVSCTTQAVSEGDVSGTIAITNSTPRRQKQVETQVTVEITKTPPTTADRAYDLGAISCSVTSVQTKLQSGDGSVATAVDGSTTTSSVGYQRSFASSANIQHYVGSYLTSSSSSGSVSYQSSRQPYLSAPNAISQQTAFSSASSSCTGTGATAATGYSEVGVISRTVNAVLSALDGTTYYQVVTEETI